VRVAVFCKGEHERAGQRSQSRYVGGVELMDKVAAGFLDFDCAIATPEDERLSKLGKSIGPPRPDAQS